MKALKQLLACGFAGAIFGCIFLRFEDSLLGMAIGSSMGVIFIWILYTIAFLLVFVGKRIFNDWIFIFPAGFSEWHGFLFLRDSNYKTRIFKIDMNENCGVEVTKNIADGK
ncbi:hypothetical protein [Janthinobacterium tructae]|uniref:Lipoprotein n=1 Tax=Janthinobacterium tructae TaxID=2590869 RepID=A0A4Y6RCK2_9BURK|nr:hypothetical protein [Janthinobacterium tructae]QDG70224.1 hypothetical protein FJQ89_07200 [Janthinobacterium tructae]